MNNSTVTIQDAPAPAPGAGAGPSSSVMFLVYMVIGFSVTLSIILLLLGSYYLSRCCLRRAQRRRAAAPQTSAASTILEPKEVFVVVQPGGSTTMAYREGEELRGQVARSKGIPVKRVVINLAADCTTAGLIAARHPSASSAACGAAEPDSGNTQPEAQPPHETEMPLRARYGSPSASPKSSPSQVRQPGSPGSAPAAKPQPLPLPARLEPAEGAERPPACLERRSPLGSARSARLPERPGPGDPQRALSAEAADSGLAAEVGHAPGRPGSPGKRAALSPASEPWRAHASSSPRGPSPLAPVQKGSPAERSPGSHNAYMSSSRPASHAHRADA